MKLTRRVGWIISLQCKCNADIVHIITESEVRDENGELPGAITCKNCGRPILAIGDDDKLYAIGERIL